MAGSWTFVLTDAGGNALAELSTASGRTIAFKRCSYAEVNLTLSHEDDAASLLFSALANTGVPRLKGYRRGPNDTAGVLRFRGPLAAMSETSEETSLLTATFRSPFSVLVGDGDKSGRFLTSQFPTIYNATDAGLIANELLDTANRDSPTGLATDPSLVGATTARNATYPVGQNIGSAIMNLSALLDGFDFFETFVESGTLARTPAIGGPVGLALSLTSGIFLGSGNYWLVTAVVGGVETNTSNEVTHTGLWQVGSPPHAVRPTLTWGAVTGATAYNIYRSTLPGGETISPALVASVGSGTLTYTDTGTPVTAGAVSPSALPPLWNAEAFLNIVPEMGQVNSGARFEYGPTTLSNVLNMSRTTTPPLNSLFVTGGNGLTSIYQDATSVATYGQRYWGHYDFPDVVDQPTLDAKARALTRPNPVKTLTLIPELGLDNCPQPFDDWNLGDTVPFLASRGALSENTQLRINGFTIPLSDDGEESVSVDDPTQPSEDAIITAQLTAEVDVTS
jgi:hypothetical protein